MKEIYLKYKIYIIASVSAIICIAIVALVVVPQTLEYINQKTKIVELNNRVGSLKNKAAELKNVDVESRKKDLVVALTVLPTDRDVPQAMSVLQNLISKSNLELKSTTYQPTSKSGDVNSFSFTVSVSGSLSSIKNFMNDLQNSGRILKVETVTLGFDPASSVVDANMPLTVFYEPAPKTLITIDQPIQKITDKEEEMIANLSKLINQAEQGSTPSSEVPLGKINPFE